MKKLLLMTLLGGLAVSAFAADDDIVDEPFWTPLQINLASPLGLPWSDRDVYGIRCNLIYGHSLDVYGIDVGVVGANRGTFCGVQANVFNSEDGFFRGIQAAPLGNFTVKGNYGIQLAGVLNWGLDDGAGLQAALLNFSSAYTGVQVGLLNWENGLACGLACGGVNVAQADSEGAAVGLVNHCKGNLTGCQIGFFNMVFGHSDGLQIGAINASEDHSGVQIGFLNLNANGALTLMPGLNVSFR